MSSPKSPSTKAKAKDSPAKRHKTSAASSFVEEEFHVPHTAMVSLGTFPRQDCPTLFPAALKEIQEVLDERKIERDGRSWSAHHLICQPDTFTVDIHVPIKKKLSKGKGRVKSGSMKMSVVKKKHVGPYEKLHEAWSIFTDEVDATELKPVGRIVETYVLGPESTKDSSKYETDLLMVMS